MAFSPSSTPLITAVVCTYNRSNLLEELLQDLQAQTLPSNRSELLVVDNGSTDSTSEVVNTMTKSVSNLHYLQESKPGLAHARNRGWREAHGEYVAYIDDDARPPRDWLKAAERLIHEMDPEVFGGHTWPFIKRRNRIGFKTGMPAIIRLKPPARCAPESS